MKHLIAIVGMGFRGAEKFVASLPTGEPLTLKREADNPYDKNAVQVWAKGQHVGYLKAAQVLPIAMAMDASDEIVNQRAKLAIDGGRWAHGGDRDMMRIRVGVCMLCHRMIILWYRLRGAKRVENTVLGTGWMLGNKLIIEYRKIDHGGD